MVSSLVIFFNLYQKENYERKQGELYCPVVFPRELAEHAHPDRVTALDAALTPIDDISSAAFILTPDFIAQPPGFTQFHGQPTPEPQYWQERSDAFLSQASGCYRHDKTEQISERSFIIEGQEGYLFMPKGRASADKATNFILRLNSIVRIMDARKKEEESKLKFEIIVYRDKVELERYTHTNSVEKLKDILEFVLEKHEKCIIYQANRGGFVSLFQEFFREKISDLPITYQFVASGWYELPDGHIYAHDNSSKQSEGLAFNCKFGFGVPLIRRGNKQALNHAELLLTLAKQQEKIAVPFLFAHLSCLWSQIRISRQAVENFLSGEHAS